MRNGEKCSKLILRQILNGSQILQNKYFTILITDYPANSFYSHFVRDLPDWIGGFASTIKSPLKRGYPVRSQTKAEARGVIWGGGTGGNSGEVELFLLSFESLSRTWYGKSPPERTARYRRGLRWGRVLYKSCNLYKTWLSEAKNSWHLCLFVV